jgi:hypothetical protein
MTTFVSDTFTDTNATAITSHTGETGATWTAASGKTGATGTIQSNKLQQGATQFDIGAFYASGVPPSADYTAEMTFTVANASEIPGVCVRMSTSADTLYYAAYQANVPALRIVRIVAGAATNYDDANQHNGRTLGAGDYKMQLEVSGTGATVTVSAYMQRLSDSQWKTASTDTFQASRVAFLVWSDTDGSRITAAGKAGVRLAQFGTTAFSVDDFSAYDATASGTLLKLLHLHG